MTVGTSASSGSCRRVRPSPGRGRLLACGRWNGYANRALGLLRHGRGRSPRPRLRLGRLGQLLDRRPRFQRQRARHHRIAGGRNGPRARPGRVDALRRARRLECNLEDRHHDVRRDRSLVGLARFRTTAAGVRRRTPLVLARLQRRVEPVRVDRHRRHGSAAVQRQRSPVRVPSAGYQS
jgi:hypothetical protein